MKSKKYNLVLSLICLTLALNNCYGCSDNNSFALMPSSDKLSDDEHAMLTANGTSPATGHHNLATSTYATYLSIDIIATLMRCWIVYKAVKDMIDAPKNLYNSLFTAGTISAGLIMGIVAMIANTDAHNGNTGPANELATVSSAVAIPMLISALTMFGGFIGNVRDNTVKKRFEDNGFTKPWRYGLYLLTFLHALALSNVLAGIIAYAQKLQNPSPELLNTSAIAITIGCISLAFFVIPRYINATKTTITQGGSQRGINVVSLPQRVRGRTATLMITPSGSGQPLVSAEGAGPPRYSMLREGG